MHVVMNFKIRRARNTERQHAQNEYANREIEIAHTERKSVGGDTTREKRNAQASNTPNDLLSETQKMPKEFWERS